MPKRPKNKLKKKGIEKLKEYDVGDAIEDLTKALDIDPDDPEIYFHLACAYSLQERTENAFESIKMAVEKRMQDTEMILNHDMLAYVRMHPAFEDFLNSNFTIYDKSLIEQKEQDDGFV
jgi:Flp pilus assembly protein TadD